MAGEINYRVAQRIQGASLGDLYQVADANGLLAKIEKAGGGAIPDGYVVTRDSATGLWMAEAPSGGGLPPGGIAGDVLTKQSGTDGDADWEAPAPGGGASIYTPGKNAASHAEDDDFSSDSGAWTDVNWSGWGSLDYDTTVPGALHIRSVNTGSFTICAKLKAIPSGNWSKVLDITPPLRNHGGFPVGMIISTSASAGSGNQSLFMVSTTNGALGTMVFGYSNFGSFNGAQVNHSLWGHGHRAFLRWDRSGGGTTDTIYWGAFDPFTGEHWGGGHSGAPLFYGSATHYGIAWSRGSSGEPPLDIAFHGFYHFPTSYPARGMTISP